MILYFDTSAFLKLYLDEPGSDRIREAVGEAAAVFTHLIAYAEIRAGLAQAVRMRRISADALAHQLACFEADWLQTDAIGTDEPLVRRAGQLAEAFRLRAYDSVHLAAVERIAMQIPASDLLFACFDIELCNAAEQLGIHRLGRHEVR